MLNMNLLLKNVFLMLFIIVGNLAATTTTEVFAKYRNRIFIETGSQYGDGIQKALNAGYEKVYSIELSPTFYNHCVKRFKGNKNVKIILGDSSKELPKLLTEINEPVTFWLDGHYSWKNTARGDTNTPILNELDTIKNHHIKDHTILIDDVRQFGTVEFDFISLDEIKEKILEINSKYSITFENGHISNDVLVAKTK